MIAIIFFAFFIQIILFFIAAWISLSVHFYFILILETICYFFCIWMNYLNAIHRGYYFFDDVDNIHLHFTQTYHRTKINNSENWIKFWQRQAKWFPQKNKILNTIWNGIIDARTLRKKFMTNVLNSHHLENAFQKSRYRAKKA